MQLNKIILFNKHYFFLIVTFPLKHYNNYKHYYYYLYIETVFNPITAFVSSGVNRDWNILPHIGIGIFNNNFLHKSQACLNLGIQCNYSISHNFDIILDVSSIVGWRIYQKDEDIIPGITVGITYSFK